MVDDVTLPEPLGRELTVAEVVILSMAIKNGRSLDAIVDEVESLARETGGDLIIDRDTVPAILERLQSDGLITFDESTVTYTATDDSVYYVQNQIDEMRIAVDYAMQTGFFFTGWSRFALASR